MRRSFHYSATHTSPQNRGDPRPDGAQVIYKHPHSFLNGHVIPHRARTKWGHLVNAYYTLLKTAYEAVPTAVRFVFLSNTCIPVRTAKEAYSFLTAKSDTTFMDSPRPTDDHARFYKKFSKLDHKPVEPRLRKAGVLPDQFFKHSGWFAPCRADAAKLLQCHEAFDALNNVYAGDEHILSILRRPQFAKTTHLIHHPITYVEWDKEGQQLWTATKSDLWERFERETTLKGKQAIHKQILLWNHQGRVYCHPRTWTKQLTNKDIATFRNSGCVFARKIEKTCNTRLLRPYLR